MPQSHRPKAYSYVRFSTDAQKWGDSLRRQAENSRACAAKHDWDLVENPFEDKGVSAFKGRNAAEGRLGEFLKLAQDRKIPEGSFLIVESLDRLSRQEAFESLTLFLSIIGAGINIVTIKPEKVYYSHKPEYADLIHSLTELARANQEAAIKSERVGEAWANKRRNIQSEPLTKLCPGWLELSSEDGRFHLLAERAKIVEEIFKEADSGMGAYTIMRRLNRKQVPPFSKKSRKGWQTSYIGKILRNRAVIGEYQPHRLVDDPRGPSKTKKGKVRVPDGPPIPNYFPSVIQEDLFYRVQQGRKDRLLKGAGRKGEYLSNLFTGVAKCIYCYGPMHFENKGKSPKGGHFLVCDLARRGLGCKVSRRWRYDEFETSFLTFVRELNLEEIMLSEDEEKKRTTLASQIASSKGELTAIEQNMKRTLDIHLSVDVAQEFTAKRLEDLATRKKQVATELNKKEHALSDLSLASRNFYESKSQIKPFIEKVKTEKGDGILKLRSQIAAKLKGMVTGCSVAALGDAPRYQKIIDLLSNEPEVKDVADHFKCRLDDEKEHRRYFIVGFVDGKVRKVYPNKDNPQQFEWQIVINDEGMSYVDPADPEERENLLLKYRRATTVSVDDEETRQLMYDLMKARSEH